MGDTKGTDPNESNLLETIKKLIECPVCFELPLRPIFLCSTGHIVCNICKPKTKVCPLCRSNYSTTRNFVAETIIENSTLQCKYAEQGCPVSIRGSQLSDHMKLCNYRPVQCNDCGGRLVNVMEYEGHLLDTHAIDRVNGIWEKTNNDNDAHRVTYSLNVCVDNEAQIEIHTFRKKFYLKAESGLNFLLSFFTMNRQMCAWVSLIGQRGMISERGKYRACIECHEMEDDSVIHIWEGPVNDVRADPVNEIYQHGYMLSIPIIFPFKWRYNIKIWQQK